MASKRVGKATILKEPKTYAYISFIIALTSMLGSLYFSEIAQFTPCVLCWYQRIAMYPLVVILAVGILLRDRKLHYYALPLAISGILIGLYQNFLVWGIIPEKIAPCTNGVPCTTLYINWLGFITIPFLSLSSFILITGCMLLYKRLVK